jgi:Spy/CpxP family protein refolding chaperone
VAEQNLVTILANGLAASNFDQDGVHAAVAQVTAAATAIHEATADALNELHSVLTPPERAALVDKVESHWAVWQKANTQESDATSSVPGQLGELTASLSLTTEQANEIHTHLNDRMKSALQFESQKVAKHLRAFSVAFQSDKFDARELRSASDANAQLAGGGAAYIARFVQTLSPVLNSEQRSKFAKLLREHAAHNPSERGSP